MEKDLKKLQKKLGVKDEDVWEMIRCLIKAGFGKPHFAFLCQSGQAYSLAFDEERAHLFDSGQLPGG